jgi:phenylpropionate dioxygenase-like ring-hydroxylating dioxygenase large terminal subunit
MDRPRMRDSCGTLRDRWYVACTSSELGRARPIGREILEERLVLYRDGGGVPCCFLDRCLHRNAKLSEGRIDSGLLRCPYHGWGYDSTGGCVDVPSLGPAQGGLTQKCLERFPVQERHGLVWVYMGDPGAIECQPFEVPHWNGDGWQSYYMVTPFGNNVTNCAENFMDVPHTVFVHAGWFRSKGSKTVCATVERTGQSVLVEYRSEDDSIGYSHMLLNPGNEPMTHTDKFYMPNITRVDYGFGSRNGFIITSQCTPVSPMRTIVYTAITYRLGWLNALAGLFLPPYTRKVIQQDVEIMANQGEVLGSYAADFSNTSADVIHRFIESLREWAESGEKGPVPKSAKVEVTFHV